MLLTDMGSHISLQTLKNLWPLIALPIFMLFVSYLIGKLCVKFFNQPLYIVPGMVFNNVVAMPMLLLSAISHSDVLNPLLRDGESIEQALVRAKAYVLLHGIVHNLARFALGPLMLKSSSPAVKEESTEVTLPTETTSLLEAQPHANSVSAPISRARSRLFSSGSIDIYEAEDIIGGYKAVPVGENGEFQFKRRKTLSSLIQSSSRTNLQDLSEAIEAGEYDPADPLYRSASHPDLSHLPIAVVEEHHTNKSLISRIIGFVDQFLNPAVNSAIIAIIIGITPPLHYLFYDNIAISSSITESIKNIGGLYPALQLFALGSKLVAPLQQPVRGSTIFLIGLVRFVLAGIISISAVSFMSTHCSPDVWPMDKMLNFVLMITPVGPPAITLAAVAEIAGVSESEVTAVSRMLLITYAIAPLVAPSVAVALSIAYQI